MKNLELINYYKGTNNDSLLHYSKQLQTANDICLKYVGKIHEVLAVYNESNYDESEKLAKQIIYDLSKKNEPCLKKIKIESLNRLFWIKKNQQLYNEAFDYLLEIKKEIKTFPKDSSYYKNIEVTFKINSALIKSLLGHYFESRKILREYLKPNRKNNKNTLKEYSNVLNRANVLNLIGESYLKSSNNHKSSDLDSASLYFKKAYEVAEKFTPQHINSKTIYNLREAEILIAKKDFKKAINLINKYSFNSEKFNTSQNINSLKAISFYNLNKEDSAYYYSYEYLKKLNNKKINKKRIIAVYDILSNQFYKNHKTDSAFKYSELTIAALNKLNKNKSETNRAHYLYNFNNIKKLNAEIIDDEKDKKTNLIILIIVVTFLTSITIYFILRKNKKTTTNLKQIKIEDKKPLTPKKIYNIDEKLENSLLAGISAIEKSKDFLKPDFNINILAKKLNTNTSYLSYLINRESKQSFKQYITQLRIEYLIRKLKDDSKFRNYTIKSLAEEIGYTNASAFTRAFKKYKGVTPSEFIKSLE